MKLPFLVRPLVVFPRPVQPVRKNSPFRADFNSTLALLSKELKAIKAKNVVLQLYIGDSGLRADGMPKVALPPEIVLSFERETGAYSMPCDRFYDWRDNLRAIALSMEALRKVDMYGVTQNGEQYRGWEALPPKSNDLLDLKTPADAAQWLASITGESSFDIKHHSVVATRAYRIAARKLHPDAPDGDAAKFRLLKKVQEILKIS